MTLFVRMPPHCLRPMSGLLICLVAGGTAACGTAQPGLPPPGFGSTPTLFYPIAVAVDPSGQNLYVANSNFDQNYTSGSIVQLPTAVFNPCTGSQAASPTLCSDANQFGDIPFQASFVQSQALLDSFAGEMFIDCPPLATAANYPACNNVQKRLYMTTRNNNTLSSALLDATTGHLICPNSGTTPNCSANAILLGGAPYNMADPFAFTLAVFPPEGSSTPVGQIVVTHQSQGETSMNGVGDDAVVAVIPQPAEATPPAAPTTAPFSSVSYTVDLAQPNVTPASPAASSVAVSPSGTIYVGGCFVLTQGEVVVPCDSDANITQYHENPIRFFSAAANQNAEVQSAQLGGEFSGGQIVAMQMSSDGQHLYAATTTPNALVTIDLPQAGLTPLPVTRSVVTLANGPNQILVLPRSGGLGDLVAVTASDPNVVLANSNAFIVVDPTLGTVVAQLQPLGLQPNGTVGGVVGRTPYGMAASPTVTGTGASQQITSYRVFVALFSDCAVAAIDVPTATPWNTTRVSILGSCPNGI